MGRLLSLNGEPKILKSFRTGPGYSGTRFVVNGKRKHFYTHRLVAAHFIPNPYNYPQINHKDGHKINNYYNNLEWVTPKENASHASKMGLLKGRKGQKCNLAKLKDLLGKRDD